MSNFRPYENFFFFFKLPFQVSQVHFPPPLLLALTGECQWLHLQLIKEMRNFCKTLFPVVEYAYGTIPTYPSGQIGFMLCSKNPVSVCRTAFAVSLSNSPRFWGDW